MKPFKKTHATLDRLKVVSLEQVLPLLGGPIKAEERTVVDGVPVHVTGLRLATFKQHGIRCHTCGVEAKFFAFERNRGNEQAPYHLNLYAVDKEGSEVLMTHDHTLARSLGGKDNLSNTKTMCCVCNSKKSVGERILKEKLCLKTE